MQPSFPLDPLDERPGPHGRLRVGTLARLFQRCQRWYTDLQQPPRPLEKPFENASDDIERRAQTSHHIDCLVEAVETIPSSETQIELAYLGGEAARIAPDETLVVIRSGWG